MDGDCVHCWTLITRSSIIHHESTIATMHLFELIIQASHQQHRIVFDSMYQGKQKGNNLDNENNVIIHSDTNRRTKVSERYILFCY